MIIDPACNAFLARLASSIAEANLWWEIESEGRSISPDALTGICKRRVPLTRGGKLILNLDEQLWGKAGGQHDSRHFE